ncbi:MAG: hypothetical protein H7Y15_05610, partial [Pseudonocardia sp.]|nr:hypothetical protein [Pseudonocardia sp.]
MGENSPVGRYLTSRKNTFGLAGALVGPVLSLAGIVGDIWPVVSVGLYAAIALVTPPPPPPTIEEDPLIDVLRYESGELRGDLRDLPAGVGAAVVGILDVLAHVLDRLEHIADRPADQVEMPRRLAEADGMIRHDLPECLDVYRTRPPTANHVRAAAALVEQLGVIATA